MNYDMDPRMGSLSWLQPSLKLSQLVPLNILVSRNRRPFGFGTAPPFGTGLGLSLSRLRPMNVIINVPSVESILKDIFPLE